MRDSLDPTLLSRLHAMLRPDWSRTLAARRFAAATLVVLAAISALRPDPAAAHTEVVVAARDLSAGTALADGDLKRENRLATTVPDGAQIDPGG